MIFPVDEFPEIAHWSELGIFASRQVFTNYADALMTHLISLLPLRSL